ncbi:hypothetical protein ZL58_14045 [Salmonella enterica subsp. enterica serovar Typhimurium]|nr:hypothetical protein [Salmonella enterica subsp. enterica serovar Typhimurium]
MTDQSSNHQANLLDRETLTRLNTATALLPTDVAAVNEMARVLLSVLPVFNVEVSGEHWLNAGPTDGADFAKLPDGIITLYAVTGAKPAPDAEIRGDLFATPHGQYVIKGRTVYKRKHDGAWALMPHTLSSAERASLRLVERGYVIKPGSLAK